MSGGGARAARTARSPQRLNPGEPNVPSSQAAGLSVAAGEDGALHVPLNDSLLAFGSVTAFDVANVESLVRGGPVKEGRGSSGRTRPLDDKASPSTSPHGKRPRPNRV